MPKARYLRRYDHHHFTGWLVVVRRRGQRWARYFSDKPHGRGAAQQAARTFRDRLLAGLPPATKVKRRNRPNTTGVVGVARVKERTRAGRPFIRYIASWPGRDGRARATFSIAKHGEAQARRLAIRARKAGLAELGL